MQNKNQTILYEVTVTPYFRWWLYLLFAVLILIIAIPATASSIFLIFILLGVSYLSFDTSYLEDKIRHYVDIGKITEDQFFGFMILFPYFLIAVAYIIAVLIVFYFFRFKNIRTVLRVYEDRMEYGKKSSLNALRNIEYSRILSIKHKQTQAQYSKGIGDLVISIEGTLRPLTIRGISNSTEIAALVETYKMENRKWNRGNRTEVRRG